MRKVTFLLVLYYSLFMLAFAYGEDLVPNRVEEKGEKWLPDQVEYQGKIFIPDTRWGDHNQNKKGTDTFNRPL